ncbi:WSC domain-containing protein, partial [Lentinula edodes]
YSDNTSAGRLLTINSGLPPDTMTVGQCIEYCSSNNWAYAGVEYASECLLHEVGSQVTATSDCNMPCTGDPSQTCGGPNLIDVYWDGDSTIPSSPPTLYKSYWSYSGCFVDDTSQRTLSQQVQPYSGSVSPQSCADTCAFYGYTVMGTEFGGECWCGNSTGPAAQVPDTACGMTCTADRDYLCGDANLLSVYHNTPPQETYTGECLDLNLPTWTDIPTGWYPYSCFIDNTSAGRLLTTNSGLPSSTMTKVVCIEYCVANNWTYAGVEDGGECYCDELFHEDGWQGTDSSECNMPCNGDPTQTCGGPNRIDVYWDGDFYTPSSPSTLSRSYWSYSGCFEDSPSQRTLSAPEGTFGGVTPATCADACAFNGYTVMGTEYGGECWCGNSTGTAAQVSDTECAMTCSADRDYLCGDANRLSVYHHNPPPPETYSNQCITELPTWLDSSHFSLLADPKEPSTSGNGWDGAILRIIDVLTVEDTTWSILSVRCIFPHKYALILHVAGMSSV